MTLGQPACLSAHMQHRSHRRDDKEMWYVSILLNYVDRIQASLKQDNNKGAIYMTTYVNY
jgi:hypothetical protein